MRKQVGSLIKLYLIALVWLVACSSKPEPPLARPVSPAILPPTPAFTPMVEGLLPPTPQSGALPATAVVESTLPPAPPTAVSARWSITAVPGVPSAIIRAAQELSAQHPASFTWTTDAEADVTLALGQGALLAHWVYAVAAPFATVADTISMAELAASWQGSGPQFVTTAAQQPAQAQLLGMEVAETAVAPVAEAALQETLWSTRPALTVLPFDQLTPDLKVLALDGQSPLKANFDVDTYPLVLEIGAMGEETAVSQLRSSWAGPVTNREPDRLTRVAMSGVTALTRATAYQMELNGVLHPSRAVRPLLRSADIAHVSHEVSFAPDCPYPDPVGGTVFCARDKYLELLVDLGIDLVELTGNHVNDWGAENMVHSLELYEAAGMTVFGGGANIEAAAQPALFTHNGNRIAFVGCNPRGPSYAWATAVRAGSRPCDDSFAAQIANLQAQGYLVMATLQYEEFYHYAPTAQQEIDFQALIEAGATAVSGSQGHHAQGFALPPGGFIHYGLGNLFFDQMDMLGTRQTFVDTYVVYDGRLLSVELWTGLIENWCCPREITPEERRAALTAVFQASGW